VVRLRALPLLTMPRRYWTVGIEGTVVIVTCRAAEDPPPSPVAMLR